MAGGVAAARAGAAANASSSAKSANAKSFLCCITKTSLKIGTNSNYAIILTREVIEVQDYDTLTQYRAFMGAAVREDESLSIVRGKPLDLDRFRGRGERMFPDMDAQDYIRELRDCDRDF